MDLIFILFFGSLFLILHTYVLYPISIQLVSLLFRKNYYLDESISPKISIIISTFNEEKVIENTITNLCLQNYSKDKFEVIIGSDGSTDQTNNIIIKLLNKDPYIKFIPFDERRGKKFVINDLVSIANGEILVFCDSNTIYNKDAISELVKYYADERIGGVSGRLELIEASESIVTGNREATYWKYESWIKGCEGRLGYLIGANGGIYSIRKKYFTPMPVDISVVDDLYLSLKVLDQGKDMVYCKQAIACETTAPSIKLETERKARIIPRSFETIKQVKRLLFSKRFLISYNLWSHKIIRWFTPIILIFLFLSNIIISFYQFSVVYNITLVIQFLIVFFGMFGYICTRLNLNIRFLQLVFYFLVSNYALIKGFYRYFTKKFSPTWNSTPR